jgi:hypothetical protein
MSPGFEDSEEGTPMSRRGSPSFGDFEEGTSMNQRGSQSFGDSEEGTSIGRRGPVSAVVLAAGDGAAYKTTPRWQES